MKNKIATAVKLFLGILISSTGVYFFLKGVDLSLLLENISRVSPVNILGALFFAVFTLYLRALRWNILLPKLQNAKKDGLFPIVVVGFMINNILPARIGELVRAFVLWNRKKFPLAISIGSLLVERVIDTVVFFMFFAVPVFLIDRLSFLKSYALFLLLISTVVIVSFILYRFFKTTIDNLVLAIVKILPEKISVKVEKIFLEVTKSMDWLYDTKKVIGIVALSPFISFCYSAIILLFVGSGPAHFGFLGSLFSQASAAFGSAIPLAPGYIGTVHAAMRGSMDALGLGSQRASVCAILYHAANYIPVTLLGIFYFFRMKLSFGELKTIKSEMTNG